MIDPEDLEPRRGTAKPRDLERMSIDALQEYMAELEAEIERVQAMIAAKEAQKIQADAIFKK